MPIFDITLRTPSSNAVSRRLCASSGLGLSPPTLSVAASRPTVSSARRGQIDVGSVAEQRRDHVRVARLVRLDEQGARRPQAPFDEPVVGRGHGEQARDRRAVAAGERVGDADGGPACRGQVGARIGDALDGAAEALRLP